ncbi:hypothetical protein GOC14_32510, partial [Sinorhizobium meliloti]|nr:hypothetical protein [Sinorhizobium meliloti]
RGRLFLGIGGRDHFGIRGRIASEFALTGLSASRISSWPGVIDGVSRPDI